MDGPRLFIVRPDAEPQSVSALLDRALKRATDQEIEVKTFRSRRIRMTDEARERAVEFLEPDDAHGLYRAIHANDVLTLVSQQTYIRRDPSRDPPARRVALTLESYVRYKAAFALVRSDREVEAALARFAASRAAAPSCSGIDDPRALPLHVFDTAHEWLALGSETDDRRFQEMYGPPHTRCDDGGKTWSRANHHHGSLTLRISRCVLPDGVHWDVTAGRRNAVIFTANSVWQLQGRRGSYANVYPNAQVRSTRGSGCRRVWPRQ